MYAEKMRVNQIREVIGQAFKLKGSTMRFGSRRISAILKSIRSHFWDFGRRPSLAGLALTLASLALTSADAFAACTVPNTLTNGQTTDASQVMANFNSLLACINTTVTSVQTQPQGRLTLTSNTPVMTADATAQSTIYYAPYQGYQIPIAGVMYNFSQLPYSLSTSAHLSGNLYDIFAYYSSGSVALCTGPAWSSGSTRSASINLSNGIWSNQSSLTCTVSGGGSTTTIAANNSTYLGTFYATANGQTGMAFKPSTTSGGTNNILGLWNAYNRELYTALCRDSTVTWTKSNSTWQSLNASNSNRISFVDGLGVSHLSAFAGTLIFTTANSATASIGVNIDSTSATPETAARAQTGSASNVAVYTGMSQGFQSAGIGFHYAQAMQANVNNTGTATYTGQDYAFTLTMPM